MACRPGFVDRDPSSSTSPTLASRLETTSSPAHDVLQSPWEEVRNVPAHCRRQGRHDPSSPKVPVSPTLSTNVLGFHDFYRPRNGDFGEVDWWAVHDPVLIRSSGVSLSVSRWGRVPTPPTDDPRLLLDPSPGSGDLETSTRRPPHSCPRGQDDRRPFVRGLLVPSSVCLSSRVAPGSRGHLKSRS